MHADPTHLDTCTWKAILILNCFMHVICISSCNMHIACILNPCMLHETCMLHACRYKWNLHTTCTKVSACHHLNYIMHVIYTRFRIGYVHNMAHVILLHIAQRALMWLLLCLCMQYNYVDLL